MPSLHLHRHRNINIQQRLDTPILHTQLPWLLQERRLIHLVKRQLRLQLQHIPLRLRLHLCMDKRSRFRGLLQQGNILLKQTPIHLKVIRLSDLLLDRISILKQHRGSQQLVLTTLPAQL